MTVAGLAPGRLGDPALTIGTDPRADPRIGAALAPFMLDGHGLPPRVGPDAPREDVLAFLAGFEEGFQAVLAALCDGLPPVAGVERETVSAPGGPTVHIHRPTGGGAGCVVHMHGGGMVMLSTQEPVYVRWRDELAATGLVVVGVEFRNGAGALGSHPFPAGLDDCAAAARWAAAELGRPVVLSGESGGGNLALALSLRARREGWLDEIAGVYAQCPYISGSYADPPDGLPSLRENDGYLVSVALFAVMTEAYDPGAGNASDPECWPLRATDLGGLPPHAISVNELDPLRDEGLAYCRRLCGAGVSAVGRLVSGTCHAADVLLPGALPDVHSASVRDVSGFAHALPKLAHGERVSRAAAQSPAR